MADYRPREVSAEKVKKSDGEMAIRLERTDDILQYLGLHKREDQFFMRIFHGNRKYVG